MAEHVQVLQFLSVLSVQNENASEASIILLTGQGEEGRRECERRERRGRKEEKGGKREGKRRKRERRRRDISYVRMI